MEKIDLRNEEYWLPVKDYENKYEVSNFGRVRSLNYLHTGKTKDLKAGKNGGGYLKVQLCKDGKVKDHLVHRLVWEAFNGPIPAGMEINHLDECKMNNWLDNLEVCTPKENMNYGTRTERAAKAMIGNTNGKANINHPSKSKAVQQIDIVTGEVLNTFPSTWEAQRQTGINQGNIGKCCLNKPKYKTAGGFIWRYAN